jgi:hypothetical protein
MLRLLRRDVVPHGGWVYTQPPTGTVIKAPTWQELLRRVRRFRIANGIHVERDFEEALGQEICQQQNWGSPTCEEQEPPTVEKRQLGTLDVVNFLKVLKHWVFHNPALVEPEEADRRAAICAACPFNVDATGCFGCTNVAGMIFDVVKDRSTPYDGQLKNCQVCGCVNRAQVWVPKETLDKGVTAEMREDFPDHCWKK